MAHEEAALTVGYSDKDKGYVTDKGVVLRSELFKAFKVEEDVAREYSRMLIEAYTEVYGKEPDPTDLHAWLLALMRHEREMPEFVFDAYAKRRQ